MSKEALVIGVDGFLGGTAFDKIKNTGVEVMGTKYGPETQKEHDLGVVRLDLSNREQTVNLVCREKPKIIANFAGIAAPSVVKNNPELARQVNVEGVLNIIYGVLAARQLDNTYDPIILGAGSVEEKGNGQLDFLGRPIPITENSPDDPQNAYAAQKLEAGNTALELSRQNGIKFYWILQGNATGAPDITDKRNPIHIRHGQDAGFFVPDVAMQIAKIEKSGNQQGVLTTGHIPHERNFVYGDDAIEAYLALAKKQPTTGKYIVCANESVSLQSILDTLISFSFVKILHEIDETRGMPGQDRFYDNTKIKKNTGWTPTTTLEKALKLVLEDQRRRLS